MVCDVRASSPEFRETPGIVCMEAGWLGNAGRPWRLDSGSFSIELNRCGRQGRYTEPFGGTSVVEFWDSWVDGVILPGIAVGRETLVLRLLWDRSLGAVPRCPHDWQPGVGELHSDLYLLQLELLCPWVLQIRWPCELFFGGGCLRLNWFENLCPVRDAELSRCMSVPDPQDTMTVAV